MKTLEEKEMYRPEGWKNPYEDWEKERESFVGNAAYEAGADAMLEGLCQPESLIDTDQKIKQAMAGIPLIAKFQRGYLVFIPEEK